MYTSKGVKPNHPLLCFVGILGTSQEQQNNAQVLRYLYLDRQYEAILPTTTRETSNAVVKQIAIFHYVTILSFAYLKSDEIFYPTLLPK